ncbi:MAG: hypothetical protein ACRYFB_05095 [Janthinobacterium lividum]
MQTNNNIYLPIRAFGDFISTAAILKKYASEKVPTVIPYYLKDFFESVNASEYFNIIGYISYQDQPAFYELYKVKDVSNIKRLIKDVGIIWKESDKQKRFLLDFHSKRLFFLPHHYAWPDPAKNIYEGKYNLFSKYFTFKKGNFDFADYSIKSDFNKVLIIPDSRIITKSIDKNLILNIQNTFAKKQIDVAYFSKNLVVDQTNITYSTFKQLIQLINSYDLIIGAESLPYHLANFYDKPHFVIYNDTRHFDENFMTPFMISNTSYANFKVDNSDEVIAKLKPFLS